VRLAVVALAALLVACAPAFQPADGAAPGVTLTRSVDGDLAVFTLTVAPPVERAFLRLTGSDLDANAPECTVTATAIECVIGRVDTTYTLPVAGQLDNDWSLPAGVVCRADCYALYLTQ
jgi:hypothetical protein